MYEILNMYIFILTPGRPTGEIMVEQTDRKGDQSNPHCTCAPRVDDFTGSRSNTSYDIEKNDDLQSYKK